MIDVYFTKNEEIVKHLHYDDANFFKSYERDAVVDAMYTEHIGCKGYYVITGSVTGEKIYGEIYKRMIGSATFSGITMFVRKEEDFPQWLRSLILLGAV